MGGIQAHGFLSITPKEQNRRRQQANSVTYALYQLSYTVPKLDGGT